MNQLFGGKFAPITDTIGFLRCSAETASGAFLDWQEVIQSKRGVSLTEDKVSGDFGADIQRLLPLTSVEARRFLFIPTGSNWTAFLDNGHQGTDAFPTMSYLAEKISCEGVRATFVPEGREDRYPATVLEIYGPRRTQFLNTIRSISLGYDGAKWTFSAQGEVQPFEDVEKYSERTLKKRFTGEMLEAYLNHLEIAAFNEHFYSSVSEPTILVEKTGPIASAAREFSLAYQ